MGQKGAWPRSDDLLFKFWDSSNISGMAEVTNLKFFKRIDRKGFWGPPNISGMAKDTKLKFCIRIEGKGY